MITLRKLATLADGTRRRKIVSLLKDFETALLRGDTPEPIFLSSLLKMAASDEFWPPKLRDSMHEAADIAASAARPPSSPAEGAARDARFLRSINSIRHGLLKALGRDIAEWDLASPGDVFHRVGGEGTVWSAASTRPMRLYLEDLRSPFNVGSIFRTALAFGFGRIWVSPDCSDPQHARSKRSAMGAVEQLNWKREEMGALRKDETGTIFALELGGEKIDNFTFPTDGTIIIGSEELGISPDLLRQAENDGGVVSISLPGPKASLNVGVAFGILAEHWRRSLSTPLEI